MRVPGPCADPRSHTSHPTPGMTVPLSLNLPWCRFNSAELLVFAGGPTALVLLGASAFLEGPTLVASSGHMLLANPTPFFIAFTMSFLVNLSCFFAIQYTSSLTFKVRNGTAAIEGAAWADGVWQLGHPVHLVAHVQGGCIKSGGVGLKKRGP